MYEANRRQAIAARLQVFYARLSRDRFGVRHLFAHPAQVGAAADALEPCRAWQRIAVFLHAVRARQRSSRRGGFVPTSGHYMWAAGCTIISFT